MDRQNLGSQHLNRTGRQSNFLMQLFIGGSDGMVLMVFITTLLNRSGISRPPMIMISLAIMLLAGLIMGLSGYLASLIEKKHFKTVREPTAQLEEIRKEKRLLDNLEISKKLQLLAFEEMEKDRQHWAGLMGVATPEVPTAANPSFTNGVQTGFSYILGGMLPLLPYLLSEARPLWWPSLFISIIGLAIFGYGKSFYTQTKPLVSVLGSLLAGTLAGFSAYALSKIFVFTLVIIPHAHVVEVNNLNEAYNKLKNKEVFKILPVSFDVKSPSGDLGVNAAGKSPALANSTPTATQR